MVYGINHEHIQQRLLSEGGSLSLHRTLNIAHSTESAIQQSPIMKLAYAGNPEKFKGIYKISSSSANPKCYRCSGKHRANDCPFRNRTYC